MNDLFSLKDDVAVVIGGTGALGGAMAEALASAGASVVIAGRNEARGLACVQRIEASGGVAVFHQADSSEIPSLKALRDYALNQFGSVTILVNAAGGNRPEATLPPGGDFCKIPLEAWSSVIDLNLVGGALLPCQVFGETMVEAGKGSIINIGSLSAMTPLSRVVAYSAAKAAVVSLTLFLAREWAQKGVRVNAISPGFFPAEQNRGLLYSPDGGYTERGQQIIAHTPMARFGNAAELAGAVIWLASSRASSFVTGQNIVVDGGFTAVTI